MMKNRSLENYLFIDINLWINSCECMNQCEKRNPLEVKL